MSFVTDRLSSRPVTASRQAWSLVNPVNYTVGVVGMAAMARLGFPSSLQNAEALYALTSDTKQGRITAIYAWAALQARNHGLAFDIITMQARRQSIASDLACNIKLAIMTDLNKLNQASFSEIKSSGSVLFALNFTEKLNFWTRVFSKIHAS